MDLPMGPLFHNAAMVAADTRMDKADARSNNEM